MKPACWRANALLQRRAAGLTQSEGLRLEEHVAQCATCRDAASLLSGLRELHASSDAPLSESARRRVLERALATEPSTPQRAAAPVRVLWPALALAAVCALASVAVLRRHPLQPSAPVASDRVLTGELRRADRAPLTAALPADTALETEHGARLALAHATIELQPATRVRWSAARRTLALEAGTVTVSVDPALHQSFSVATARFDVRVIGTVFEVGLERVRVQRGRVRVEMRDGAAPVILEASGRSTFEWTSAPETAPSASSATVDDAAARPSADLLKTRGRDPATPAPDLSALLDRARGALAARDVAGARHTLSAAIAAKPARTQLAEALSLRAECDLVGGDFAAARRGYQDVARRFSKLPAAESALFAAARIEAEHGDPARAHALFERYLQRYPHGDFAREAERRLRAHGAP